MLDDGVHRPVLEGRGPRPVRVVQFRQKIAERRRLLAQVDCLLQHRRFPPTVYGTVRAPGARPGPEASNTLWSESFRESV